MVDVDNVGEGDEAAAEPGCESAGSEIDLGVPTVDRPARLTTTGGVLRLSVRNLPEGVIVGAMDEAAVWLGQDPAVPQPDPEQPKRPLSSDHRLVLGAEAPATARLEPGTYWVVAARPGRYAVAPCSDAEVSDVVASEPDPADTFGTGSPDS